MTKNAEKGKKYNFSVIDVLSLPVEGVTSFAGYPSETYDRLIPADAIVEANGVPICTISLSLQPTIGMNAQCVAVATKDQIDLTNHRGADLVLRCTFTH